MRDLFFVSLLGIFLFFGCKKDVLVPAKTAIAQTPASTSYQPMAVGNYWIYEFCKVDTAGIETSMNAIDSIYIRSDSVIGGQTYYRMERSLQGGADTGFLAFFPIGGYMMDSAGFLLSLEYSHNPVLDPVHLNDTIMYDTTSYHVAQFTVPVSFAYDSVPAGIYSGIEMQLRIRHLSTNPPYSGPYVPTYSRFVQGVGLCRHKLGFASGLKDGFVWRLLRYHV